eukprot:GFUD01013976.1.p1 GENE.GFUD01013976.1~~GFUD01013976.1.p1  ORF type:complete len:1261 (+),score=305.37 GFUD01013976.1:94-3876(+)
MVHSTSDIISCFEAEQKNTVFSALSEYLSTGQYVDISLVCKGQILRAHKVVLSSSSKYFKDFFRHQPGVNIIDLDKELAPNDLSLTLEDVQLIIGILYCVGTVEISPQRIETLLISAQVLGIPTLISFLKKIRDSINESKIIKDQPRLEYSDRPGTIPGLPNISPHHKMLAPPGRTYSNSSVVPPRRNSSTDMIYLLPGVSPAHQFPQQIFPSPNSAPTRSLVAGRISSLHTQTTSFNPIPISQPTYSRAGTPSSRTPLLDLSVVKPMTASCLNTPAPPEVLMGKGQGGDNASCSPRPGPSGVQKRSVTRGDQERTKTSGGQERPRTSTVQEGSGPGGVQDSLLSCQPHKVDPEMIFQRESSRISAASYSSFSLNYLQSPRLKSTDNSNNENHQSLDGFDQNFFMTLNTLQANQIDDLENVLLPHLSMDSRSDHPLLDLNQIDEVENNADDTDISTTSPEGGTPCPALSPNDTGENIVEESEPVDDTVEDTETLNQEEDTETLNQELDIETLNQESETSLGCNKRLADTVELDNVVMEDLTNQTDMMEKNTISTDTAVVMEQEDNNPGQVEDESNEDIGMSNADSDFRKRCVSESESVGEDLSLQEKRLKELGMEPSIPVTDASSSVLPGVPNESSNNSQDHSDRDTFYQGFNNQVNQSYLMLPQQESVSMTSPIHYPKAVTPVRITPNTLHQDVTVTPVRLTPHGGIALTPIKNLMPEEDRNRSLDEESLDEHDGVPNDCEHSSEIVMNLDKVCEGQKMKFSIPGISQAVTVNFSVEALQEMKNAALNQNSPDQSDQDNQYSEISSSEKSLMAETSKEIDCSQSGKLSKKKNNKRNLRQKLKSNLKGPKKVPKDDDNFIKPMNFLCPVCNKTFTSVLQLKKHQKFHVQKGFSCKLCHEIFEKKWMYDQHLSEKHGQKLEKAVCPECSKEFSQTNLLLAHIQTYHKEETVFKCFVCYLDFNKKHNLITHLSSWHPNEKVPFCPVCMDFFSEQKGMETHDCPGAEIKNRQIICHLHETPMSFTSRVELDNHMKREHGTEGNFNISCCICQKKFLLRRNLLKHLRNVHKQGSSIKHFCPTCGKQFYYKDDLKNHILVHEGELKHTCTENACNKAYSTLKALKKHQKNTHEVDINLVTCKICQKQLSTKFKLRTHMLVHTNAKPFSCTHCSETFKERRNVVKHIKLKHLTKKPLIETRNEDDGELAKQESSVIETEHDMLINSEDVYSTECTDTCDDSVIMNNENDDVLVEIEPEPDSTEPTE